MAKLVAVGPRQLLNTVAVQVGASTTDDAELVSEIVNP
jgi:hypothetical protein